jgi:hypothetical protein
MRPSNSHPTIRSFANIEYGSNEFLEGGIGRQQRGVEQKVGVGWTSCNVKSIE